ncbi:MAG: hypothetical protein IIC10_07630 [Proteobacteria bacterium]|nr:hypothetical protein [Pseudomonadota bacterium]
MFSNTTTDPSGRKVPAIAWLLIALASTMTLGFQAFTNLVQDPEYQAISHLREEAIRDSLLIRFRKL